MSSVSALKPFVLSGAIVLVAGSATTAVFLAGERVGRYRTARAVTEVMQGQRDPDDLTQAAFLPEETKEKIYSARGLIIANGSGRITITTQNGGTRNILYTGQTSVRSGGMKVDLTTLRVGDTVFVLGGPDQAQNGIRATLVRVVSRGSTN